MKLFWSSRSPFVRKVMVFAHETGLAERIERTQIIVAPTKPNPEVMALNPLNKLPTLVLDNGGVLYDSRVICEHLDTLHDRPRLFPADPSARIDALRRQALGDGMMDFLLVWLSERSRPAPQQSPELIAACRTKLTTVLDALEREAPALAAAPFSIAHIAIGCALGYADFRFKDEAWRTGRPQLAAWAETLHARPSFQATQPADTY
ncbi:MAG: glutathione S-transferase family protein [Hyphomicrobiaceae bacterium]